LFFSLEGTDWKCEFSTMFGFISLVVSYGPPQDVRWQVAYRGIRVGDAEHPGPFGYKGCRTAHGTYEFWLTPLCREVGRRFRFGGGLTNGEKQVLHVIGIMCMSTCK
jgi:hypothetical protein